MDSNVIERIVELEQGEKVALATIISTKGSTPRKAGAQILFYQDGRTAGTIGGGCGEAEVRRHALGVIETGVPKLVLVKLTHETAEVDGMICGGTMEVFIEPLGYSG